jgi:hypothetical protein
MAFSPKIKLPKPVIAKPIVSGMKLAGPSLTLADVAQTKKKK